MRLLLRRSILLSMLLTTVSVLADDKSPYSFSGPCQSQGEWTQQVLTQTQGLITVAQNLAQDPNCKSLATALQTHLAAVSEKMSQMNQTDRDEVNNLSKIRHNITGLRSFIDGGGPFRTDVMRLMLTNSINEASEGNKISQLRSYANSMNGLVDVASRLGSSMKVGVSTMNALIDAVGDDTQCQMSSANAGQLLPILTNMVSAFAANESTGIGADVSLMISKFANMARKKTFSDVLGHLEQQQFLASVSCLIELTSDSYCGVRDGYKLFKNMTESAEFDETRKAQGEAKLIDSVAGGYFVLTHNLPVISEWVQNVQIGVPPNIPTDATFKNTTSRNVQDYNEQEQNIIAKFNFMQNSIAVQADLEAQQNFVIQLIKSVSKLILGDGFPTSPDSINFFLQAAVSMEIPFKIIGIPVPAQVAGKEGYKMDFGDWTDANYKSLPGIEDPVAMAARMRTNMEELIRKARTASIVYYNKWYIVDQTGLVNQSYMNISYDVRGSLKVVDRYLQGVSKRIAESGGDQSPQAMILDTRSRIGYVLDNFTRVETLAKNLYSKGQTRLTDQQIFDLTAVHKELITNVYDRFETMLAKTGWLGNRLTTLVQIDLNTSLRSPKVNVETYFDELYRATGRWAVDRQISLMGGNPANVDNDLSLAMSIANQNILALEELIRDPFIAMIAFKKMVADGVKPTDWSVHWNSKKRLFMDNYTVMDENKDAAWNIAPVRVARGVLGFIKENIFYNHDRYPGKRIDDVVSALIGKKRNLGVSDDEFHSAQRVFNKFCIQALAFNDQRAFWYLCKDAHLDSPLLGKDSEVTGQSEAGKYLSVVYKDKLYQDKDNNGLNHSERICAFRDYGRRNLVAWLRKAMPTEQERMNNPEPIDPPAEAVTPPSAAAPTVEAAPVAPAPLVVIPADPPKTAKAAKSVKKKPVKKKK